MAVAVGAVSSGEQGQAVAGVAAQIPGAAQADRVQEEEGAQERRHAGRRVIRGRRGASASQRPEQPGLVCRGEEQQPPCPVLPPRFRRRTGLPISPPRRRLKPRVARTRLIWLVLTARWATARAECGLDLAPRAVRAGAAVVLQPHAHGPAKLVGVATPPIIGRAIALASHAIGGGPAHLEPGLPRGCTPALPRAHPGDQPQPRRLSLAPSRLGRARRPCRSHTSAPPFPESGCPPASVGRGVAVAHIPRGQRAASSADVPWGLKTRRQTVPAAAAAPIGVLTPWRAGRVCR